MLSGVPGQPWSLSSLASAMVTFLCGFASERIRERFLMLVKTEIKAAGIEAAELENLNVGAHRESKMISSSLLRAEVENRGENESSKNNNSGEQISAKSKSGEVDSSEKRGDLILQKIQSGQHYPIFQGFDSEDEAVKANARRSEAAARAQIGALARSEVLVVLVKSIVRFFDGAVFTGNPQKDMIAVGLDGNPYVPAQN